MKSWLADFLLSLFLMTAALSGLLRAQTTTSGALAGVVIDQTNAVVPDAAVEIKDAAKGIAQSAKTDSEGVYQVFLLASWQIHAQSHARWISGRTKVGHRPGGASGNR